ncbi:MAG: Stp1/IreP family PP2C-type Ser/Thr phosphatase [Chloroflexi bacterium]|nr:Stp1/IreP family PP2C-type Ser/Thr phosphatase [Chloroflexota bacterium]
MPGPEHIRLRSSARSHMGQVRENNEDFVHLWAQDQLLLAIVADGMGGAVAGEEASRIAVDTIQKDLTAKEHSVDQIEQDDLSDKLVAVIRRANMNIVEHSTARPELKGMGTTVTLALIRSKEVIVAHVGDSRAYLIDGQDGLITQITSDHSFVEALLQAGHITREQAEDHPMRNVLYRALGQAEEVDVDLYYHHLHIGDCMVLCSDGLTRHVRPEEIAQLTLGEDNPEVISQKLVDLANKRGGEDNVSVIVVKVDADDTGEKNKRAVATYDDEEDTVLMPNHPALQPSKNQEEEYHDEDPTLIDKDRSFRAVRSFSGGEGSDPFKPTQ